MPDDKKAATFKPADPKLPGVRATLPKRAPADMAAPALEPHEEIQSRSLPAAGIAVAAAALIVVAALVFWFQGSASKASRGSEQSAGALETSGKLPLGPGPVATTNELAATWAAKPFLFPDSVTSEKVPAMVVHLPDAGYWAFSLREPFGTCELEFVTDLEKLRSEYNFPADHPMVGNPCKRTVYDLSRYGDISNGTLVRGEIVHGPGIRPPMAIEVRVEGNQVVAVRAE